MSTDPKLLSPMGTAALQYARAGWKVFPCHERDEIITVRTADGPKPKKYPAKSPYLGKGFKDATTDEQVIIGWWKRWPNAMIGLPAGDNGLLVLDFDPRIDPDSGEVYTLENLKAATEEMIGCALPTSLVSVTQSDGAHLFLSQPTTGEPIGNRGNLPTHVDVRGVGGYVIAPPSVLYPEEGEPRRYRWLKGRQDTPPAEAPVELLAVLRARKASPKKNAGGDQPPTTSSAPRPHVDDAARDHLRKYAMSALDAELQILAAVRPGEGRNIQINKSAFKLGQIVGGGGLSEATVRAAIREVIDGMPNNDNPDGAYQTLENGLTAGMGNPRDLTDVIERARERASRPPRLASRPRPPANDDGGQQPFRAEANGGGKSIGVQGDADDDEAHRCCIFKPHTDLGNAERFFERYGHDFRWSPALGWLGWDGRRWITLDQDEKNVPPVVLDAVFKTIRAIQDEGDLIEATGGVRPEWLDDWEMRAEDHRKERDLSETRRAELELYRKHQTDDAEGTGDDRDRLNCIVDWRKGRPVTRADAHRKWGRTSEASGKLGCIARLAQPWMAVKTGAFDADPLAINVLNGTLRFRRVTEGAPGKITRRAEWMLCPHDRKDLISKLAPIEVDPEAKCPIYDDMFAWAQPDERMRRYLHQWAGLCLTGDMGEQILHFWYGRGGNGKSTAIDAWASCAGDYATTVPIETFLDQGIKKRGDQATPDLARLGGVRMLRTSEPERGAKLAAALIKLVTGGEPLAVRFLNRGFFDLQPLFKLTISGNYRPEIPDTDDGIWRRVKLIPWDQRVRDQQHPEGTREKDPELPNKLRGEMPGIFNRLMNGLLDWLANGLVEPESVTAATQEYRTQSDPLARFLKLCTKPAATPDAKVQSSKLHELFVAWCKSAGEREWTQKGFSQAMLDKGFKKKASDGMHWLGIEMTHEVRDFVDSDGKPIPFSIDDEADPPPRAPPNPAPRTPR